MELDAQLLERYAQTRDADAFTQLVRRHAGMVFAAARRVTQGRHEAEEIARECLMEQSVMCEKLAQSDGKGICATLGDGHSECLAMEHARALIKDQTGKTLEEWGKAP